MKEEHPYNIENFREVCNSACNDWQGEDCRILKDQIDSYSDTLRPIGHCKIFIGAVIVRLIAKKSKEEYQAFENHLLEYARDKHQGEIENLKTHIREVERHLKDLYERRNRCQEAPAREVFDMVIKQKQEEKKESIEEIKNLTGLEWYQIGI